MKQEEIIALGVIGLFLLGTGKVISDMPSNNAGFSTEDKELLARLLTSETSDVRAWQYILSAARDTAANRGVSVARMLRSHRMQKRSVPGKDIWEYVGSMEDSGKPGPLFTEVDADTRWVRWASTRQNASRDAISFVDEWVSHGAPAPFEGFKSYKFFEKDSESDAVATAEGYGWSIGKWVFGKAHG